MPEDPVECRTADQCDVWREFETVNVDLHDYDTIRGIWADASMKLELERVAIHGTSLVDECVFTVVDQWGRAQTSSCDALDNGFGSGLKEVLGQIALELIKAIIAEVTKEQKRELSAKCAKIHAPANSTTAHTPDQDANNSEQQFQAALRAFHNANWGNLFALESELRSEPDVIHVFHALYPNGALVEFEVLRVDAKTADVRIGNPKSVEAKDAKESPCS